MCPDRHLISLYFDNELPTPWKEKMEAHLKSCNKCGAVLAGYRNLEMFLSEAPSPVEAAQKRVWEKLAAKGLPVNDELIQTGERRSPIKRVLNRRIMLPLPAAAGFIVIVFLALLGIRSLNRPPSLDPIAVVPDYLQMVGNEQEMLPMEDMAGVLQYLSNQDYGDFVVIRLPESRKFSRIGEPALINAADYSRRNASR